MLRTTIEKRLYVLDNELKKYRQKEDSDFLEPSHILLLTIVR